MATDRREAIAEWLRANNIDPGVVPLHGGLSVYYGRDGRRIEYTAKSADGRWENRTAPLLVDPPAEWHELRPQLTPEQLEALTRASTTIVEAIRHAFAALVPIVQAAAVPLARACSELQDAGLIDEHGQATLAARELYGDQTTKEG